MLIKISCRVLSMSWYTFALIITAAYGGNLRAYLLKPDMHPAVETISDVVNSGLPWSMVQWGDTLGVSLSLAQDQDTKTFWEDMKSAEYTNFPYEIVRSIKFKRFSLFNLVGYLKQIIAFDNYFK